LASNDLTMSGAFHPHETIIAKMSAIFDVVRVPSASYQT
jgi:hypothetical protein